jgi:hypothetical protein
MNLNRLTTWRGRLARAFRTIHRRGAETAETLISGSRLRAFCVSAVLLVSLASTGCVFRSSAPALRVNPNGSGVVVAQKFPRAYYGKNGAGEYEIVLVAEGNETPRSQGKILYPTNVVSLRQIVHIRVLWNALPGTRIDQPTSTNSTINWYVQSNMPNGDNDKIQYGGAGFVNVYPGKKNAARIVVRSADLVVRNQSGELNDPFGKPSLSGSFDAIRNDGIVRDILSSVATKVATR